jgi:hypothetical protein
LQTSLAAIQCRWLRWISLPDNDRSRMVVYRFTSPCWSTTHHFTPTSS